MIAALPRADRSFRLALLIAAAALLACLIWAGQIVLAFVRFQRAGDDGTGLGVSTAFLLLLPVLGGLVLAAVLLDRRQVNWLGGLVMLAGFVNFVTWSEIGWRIGGYAALGRIDGERYFLGNHGALTPVSPALYQYSQTHGASAATMIIFVLALLAVQAAEGGLKRRQAQRNRGSQREA